MNKLNLDFETRSPVDLQKCGAYKYAEHPDTEVLVIAVSVDGGPVITWDKREAVEGNAAVSALRSAVEQGTEITAFNSQFEFAILKHVCPRQFGFPAPDVNQMRCSKAVALNAGIPSSLEKAAAFLRLGDQKDPVGKALIRRFSVPRKDGTFLEPDADETFTVGGKRVTTPQAFQMFVDYCHKDVVVEMAVADALKPFALKGISLEGFLMTARMNDRGVPIDVEAVRMADAMIRKHAATLSRRFKEITGLSPSQNKEALKWLKERGYKGPNLDKHSRPKFGNDPDMSADAREAVHILGEYSYAAVKKIPAYLNWVMSDGKVRGCFTWHGAGKTGRHTSQGIQLQNQKKPSKKLRPIIESAYDDLKSGIGIEDFSMLYGNPYEVIASMARYFIRFDDMEVYDSDFTSVEALILPKLIGAERILDRFRSGEDLYIPVANRLGFDRDVGKTITLACIAEGERVLTDRGLVPIEKVSCCHRVWDGVEWVTHEGVIYKGKRKVIQYQGVKATEDHEVYCVEEKGFMRKVPLGGAKSLALDLVTTGDGWGAIRLPSCDLKDYPEGLRLPDAVTGEMRLRRDTLGGSTDFGKRTITVLPEMRGQTKNLRSSNVASPKNHGAERTLHESIRRTVQELRCQRDTVQLPLCHGRGDVGCEEPRSTQGVVFGSGGQQRSLRTGKSSMGESAAADVEHEEDSPCGGLQRRGLALQPGDSFETASFGDVKGSGVGIGTSSRRGEAEELADDTGEVAVFDILNAGPRNRFTVSGKLVSNCQFEGGWRAVHKATGEKLSEKECRAAVKAVQEENPEFKPAWKKFHDTWMHALKNPGSWHEITKHVRYGYSKTRPFPRMLMELPSGRRICLPYPQADPMTMVKTVRPDGGAEWTRKKGHLDLDEIEGFHTYELSYWGHIKDAVWGRVSTRGGDQLQTATQATGGDLLVLGCIEAEKRGFLPFLTVHDQVLVPARGDIADLENALCKVPDWFDGFPLQAESKKVRSYCK